MHEVMRTASSKVNVVVGPFVMLMGVLAAIAAVALSILAETVWFLALFIPAALALGGGLFILWGARRSRLEITPQQLIWCGFIGSEKRLDWAQIAQISPPPAGSSHRVAAIAHLVSGQATEIRALWESSTSPGPLAGVSDHSRALHLMIQGHQAFLAQQR